LWGYCGIEIFYEGFDLGIFQQESVVSIQGGYLPEAGIGDKAGQLLLFAGWEEDIGGYADDEGAGGDEAEGCFDAAAISADIVGVHAEAEGIVTECVEASGEFFSLVALIGGRAGRMSRLVEIILSPGLLSFISFVMAIAE
jgi:hypothetical protein